MSVSISASGTIVLTGDCMSEEAESLLQLLLSTPGATVDWRLCTSAHSAVIQILIAAAPPLQGPPACSALAQWVAPALSRAHGE
jgi:hypothetical protein